MVHTLAKRLQNLNLKARQLMNASIQVQSLHKELATRVVY